MLQDDCRSWSWICLMRKLFAGLAAAAAARVFVPVGAFPGRTHCARIGPFLLAFVVIISSIPSALHGGVLSENDFKRVEMVKQLFEKLMIDLVQTSKRTDISPGDADCVTTTMRELLQISEELSSYEY